MKRTFFCFIFSLFISAIHGQNGCYIRLTDKCFFDTIVPDSSWILVNRDFVSDTTTSLIYLKKASGRKLNISGKGYEPQEINRKWRSFRNDTLTITMVPDAATIERYRKKMWIVNNPADTLEYADFNELKLDVLRYMACLNTIKQACNGGMCNYSNTFHYDLRFLQNNGVWKAFRVLNSGSTNCDELEESMSMFPEVFPCFKLSQESEWEEFSMKITFYPFDISWFSPN